MYLLRVRFLQKRNIILFLCLLGFPGSMIYSQADEYFPLQIGNTWTYDYIVDGQVMTQSSISVIDTVKIENKTYYLFDRYFYCRALKDSQLYRIDSTKVYRYDNDHEQMFLDLSADVNDSWNVDVYDPNLDTLTTVKVVLLSKTGNFSANGREFENAYEFYFDNSDYATDMSWGITVAPHVGCVIWNINTLVPRGFWFRSGMINQIYYPDLVNSIEPYKAFNPVNGSVWAYPNPFNTTISIMIESNELIKSKATVDIYNIQGKLVKSLGFIEDRIIQWDGTNENGITLPSGIYFLIYFANDIKIVEKITLIR